MSNTFSRIIRHTPAVVCGMLFFAGCADDVVSGNQGVSSAGTVVVEYMVEEASTRSVGHTPWPTHERISSLVYLLYDERGDLVKKREIPGIADMEEGDWPMKRSTMTWDQREALKDTLESGQSYNAVFVANADPSLFDGEEVLHITQTEGDMDVPLPFEKIFLSLPVSKAFDDHNMYYLCVRNIVPKAETDREHHLDCPVLLQRMVSRTDFFSDDYPEWDSDFAKGKIRDFTDKVYSKLIPVTKSDNPLYVNDMLSRFTRDFAAWCALNGSMAIPGFPVWEADFAIKVNGLDCRQFLNSISGDDEKGIKEMLYTSCRGNAKLRNLWLPWRGLSAKVAYQGCADRLYVSDRKSGYVEGESFGLTPKLDISEIIDDVAGKVQHSFTVIGFGENPDATADNVQNIMKEIHLFSAADDVTPVSVIPVADDFKSFAWQGGNERVQLAYVPIGKLEYNNSVTDGKTWRLEPVNLREALSESLFLSNEFVQILQNFFKSEKGTQYGEGIDKFILEITLPDLSQDGAIVAEPEWRLR